MAVPAASERPGARPLVPSRQLDPEKQKGGGQISGQAGHPGGRPAPLRRGPQVSRASYGYAVVRLYAEDGGNGRPPGAEERPGQSQSAGRNLHGRIQRRTKG